MFYKGKRKASHLNVKFSFLVDEPPQHDGARGGHALSLSLSLILHGGARTYTSG